MRFDPKAKLDNSQVKDKRNQLPNPHWMNYYNRNPTSLGNPNTLKPKVKTRELTPAEIQAAAQKALAKKSSKDRRAV